MKQKMTAVLLRLRQVAYGGSSFPAIARVARSPVEGAAAWNYAARSAADAALDRHSGRRHVSSSIDWAARNGALLPSHAFCCVERRHPQQRRFSSKHAPTGNVKGQMGRGIRFSALLCKHLGLSRKQSERMIMNERVTLFGKVITSPSYELRPSSDPNQDSSTAMKVDGKLVRGVEETLKLMYAEQELNGDDDASVDKVGSSKRKNGAEVNPFSKTRVWLANKLRGELITEEDPVGRPSMLARLSRGGVGQSKKKGAAPIHLKPVGRLDMMTEGLMIFTNDGKYARELELPGNKLWRTYRVRVHGRLTMGKLNAIRKGLTIRMNDSDMMMAGGGKPSKPSGDVVQTGKLMRYKGIKVSIERKSASNSRRRGKYGGGSTNTWLQMTCTEGKNRQLRRILGAMGLDATRLIRISYGDYDLNTIPPGMAIEVPCKKLKSMKKRGHLMVNDEKKGKKEVEEETEESAADVQWVNYS